MGNLVSGGRKDQLVPVAEAETWQDLKIVTGPLWLLCGEKATWEQGRSRETLTKRLLCTDSGEKWWRAGVAASRPHIKAREDRTCCCVKEVKDHCKVFGLTR